LNVFQPLLLKNQTIGKIVYIICFIPMIAAIPMLLWLVAIQLRWLIPHLLKLNI